MSPSMLSFKELRRRSRASFRTERSTDTSSEGGGSHETAPSSGSVTPPSLAHQSDPALNLQVKETNGTNHHPHYTAPRPRPPLTSSANSSRYSVSGMSGLGSPSPGSGSLPMSQYAPRIHNLQDGKWAYQKVLQVHGTIGDNAQPPIDGTLTVSRLDDSFPPISWPVCSSYWKALVYLQPGPNRLRFEFSSPKLVNSSTSNPIHASYILIHMMPQTNTPPLQLAILLGKDSPGTFDSPPARAEKEGNGLETAVKKFRMAAYLWQAFTSEQMWRHKLGRRTFRLEEDWTSGTANYRDMEHGNMRSEARIHIIRTDKTVAELRDLNKAQQYDKANDKNALYNIAADAVKKHFQPLPGQKQYVAVLLMDTHWDPQSKVIRGHAALGGNAGDLHLAVFGSHCLYSYPTTFEEVVPAFTDCTPTDQQHVANDCGDAGSSWEAANIGIGAHLHEVGHLFGCPHQEGGMMLRDYVVLNRTFVSREAFCTRTKSKGGLVLMGDECHWHRLDCLRFRAHPAFRHPTDPPPCPDDSVQAFPVENGNVLAVAASGISFVEIYGEGDDVCHGWMEWPAGGDLLPAQRQVTLTENDLRAKLPEAKKKSRLRISIKSHGGGSLTIEDVKKFSSKDSTVKVSSGKMAYRSQKIGKSKMQGSQPGEVVFHSAVKSSRYLSKIVVYHGSAVDGLEFHYDDGSTQLFGKKGGKAGGDSFEFDIRRGETVSGFYVRANFWIEGIQILTSLGRRSPIYGNPHGGDAHTIMPPRGYNICGVSGSYGQWLDGFAVLIKR